MHDIDDYTVKGTIGEEILDQVKAIHEIVGDFPTRSEFNDLKESVMGEIQDLKVDVKAIKSAVIDHSTTIKDHEQRIGALEQVA